jgi:hypothetical protein
MTIRVARIQNKFVRIVRTARTVDFSQQENWVLIEHDIHLPEHKRQRLKWVPATTQFDWVRDFHF